jgi:hypothetical protein
LTDTEGESIGSGSAQFEDTSEALASRLALAQVVEPEVDDALYDICVNELCSRQIFEVRSSSVATISSPFSFVSSATSPERPAVAG